MKTFKYTRVDCKMKNVYFGQFSKKKIHRHSVSEKKPCGLLTKGGSGKKPCGPPRGEPKRSPVAYLPRGVPERSPVAFPGRF